MSNCKSTLYVVRFSADATGQWILMELTTPSNPNQASQMSAVEFAALGNAQQNDLVKLSGRIGIAGSTAKGGAFNCDRTNQGTVLPDYQNQITAYKF